MRLGYTYLQRNNEDEDEDGDEDIDLETSNSLGLRGRVVPSSYLVNQSQSFK